MGALRISLCLEKRFLFKISPVLKYGHEKRNTFFLNEISFMKKLKGRITMNLRELAYGLKVYYAGAEETERIIMNCALVAAGADAIGGAIPGLAVPAIIISCFGAVWVMYGKLCSALGIALKKNVLKLLAKAALANIAANLGGTLVALVAGMFVPGASIAFSAVVSFVTVFLAGEVFLSLVLKMAKTSSDRTSFSDMSAADMKKVVSGIKLSKEDLNAAKKAYEATQD